jgi:hypothetical protein
MKRGTMVRIRVLAAVLITVSPLVAQAQGPKAQVTVGGSGTGWFAPWYIPPCVDGNTAVHWEDVPPPNDWQLRVFASCGDDVNWPDYNKIEFITNSDLSHAPASDNVVISFQLCTGATDACPSPSEQCCPDYRILEAVHRVPPKKLYGWYHAERAACGGNHTVPVIGAASSMDGGKSWTDSGTILQASDPSDIDCETPNDYFAGGYGDFSVVLDSTTTPNYLYFFFSSYRQNEAEQGVAVARMELDDAPGGAVQVWQTGGWCAPEACGDVLPIFPPVPQHGWHTEDPNVHWGPSVHWNTYLESYVMVMNHARTEAWGDDGFYVSFNADLANPSGWTTPSLLCTNDPEDQPPIWYPEVFGREYASGTNVLAGQEAWFSVVQNLDRRGSNCRIEFFRPGDQMLILDPPSCSECAWGY